MISFNLFSQVPGTTNQIETVPNNFLFNQNKIDTIAIEYKLDFFNYLKILNCISGTCYFTGNGFPSIAVINYHGNVDDLKIYFQRCLSGSKFILENSAFPRDDGLKPEIVNKTVIFR